MPMTINTHTFLTEADGTGITRVTGNSNDFNFGPDWGAH